MPENNPSDSYEVGYGKPPRDNQFRKGVSGNPKGRPKKALNFGDGLLRESRAPVIINENGRRRRIPKYAAVFKQLANKAMGGNIPALRTFFDLCQGASEKAALREAAQARDRERYSDAKELSDEELMRIATGGVTCTE